MSRVLRDLVLAHGVPGHEDEVRDLFRRELAGAELSTDGLGSVFAETGDTGPRILLAGHMDEVGFLVQQVTGDGFLKIVPVGGWWPHTLLAQRVRVKTRKGTLIPGVIASKPPHFLSEEARNRVMKIDEMLVDIGAANRADAVEALGVGVGDPVAPEPSWTPMARPELVMAKAFDNRVGMGVVIEAMQGLLREPLPGRRVIACGTVQEEVGTRGARVAGTAAQADVILVLEGPPADDTPGFNREESQGRLGAGVQVRIMDPSAIMNRGLVDLVRRTAEARSIPIQLTVRGSGGTDAHAFQFAGGGTPCVVLGVPARYIHTHHSIIHLEDYHQAIRLVRALVEALSPEAVAALTAF